MLEARKLSVQVQEELGGRAWTAMFVIIWLAIMAVIASLWIGANFQAPAPDNSQEKLKAAHAQVLEVVASLSSAVSAEQEINTELFERFSSLQKPLREFGQQAALGLRLPPDTKDAQTWPGKVNVLLDDLQILSDSKDILVSYTRLRDVLFGLYRPKGPVNPKQFKEASPAKALYVAVLEWHQLGLALEAPAKTSMPFTWAQLAKSKTLWHEISAQLDALELDAKQIEDADKAKVAKDMLALLSKNDVTQSMRTAEDTWTRVIVAQERLHNALNQLPPEPRAILASPPFHWSRLAFPGSVSEGLMACAGLMVLGLLAAAVGHWTRRRQLGALSKQWLTVMQQLEAAVRSIDAPLLQSIARIEALATEFTLVADKLKYLQHAITTPSEAPPKSMEEQAWDAATRMQGELESDLNLLREKLLNIHLQFCNGQTHENLVYDLAFTTEAMQTVFVTARDLGRSVALLKDSLQQSEAQGDGQDIEQLLSQVNSLKLSAKRIAMNLQELSSRLQVAVGDVPEGRRFQLEGSENEVGRPRVNQPI